MILLGPTETMSDVDPAGRVQVVLDPALPSKCMVCDRGPGNGLKFLDFNLSLDWYGAVSFCIDCIKECITAAEFDPLSVVKEELATKEKELEVALHELDRYRSALDGLSFIRPDLNPLNVDDGNESEDVGESSDTGEAEQSDPDGSDTVGGPKNLSIFADD